MKLFIRSLVIFQLTVWLSLFAWLIVSPFILPTIEQQRTEDLYTHG